MPASSARCSSSVQSRATGQEGGARKPGAGGGSDMVWGGAA